VRGCLFVLVLAALLALAGGWLGGPVLAAALVEGGLASAGFEGRNTVVRVTSDPPIAVLGGTLQRVEIGADDAHVDEIGARRIDLTLLGMNLVDRSVTGIDGHLSAVTFASAPDAPAISSIELHGKADDADAVLKMGSRSIERYAAERIDAAVGVDVGAAELREPDLLRFSVAGVGIEGRLVIEPDGRLALAADLPGNPRISLLDPAPLRVDSVVVLDDQLVLTGNLDVEALLER
jgi:hypothetical protein